MLYYFWQSGLPTSQILIAVCAYVLAIALALSLHEMSHGLVAYWCGDRTARAEGRLSLNPLKHLDPLGTICLFVTGFGWAKPVRVNPLKFRNFKRDMAFVSLAGIFTNLIIAFFFCPILMVGGQLLVSSNLFYNFVYYFIEFIFTINISLAVFNMLPIYPLDGYKIVESFCKTENSFLVFMKRYSFVIFLVLAFTGIYGLFYSYTAGLLYTGLYKLFVLILGL